MIDDPVGRGDFFANQAFQLLPFIGTVDSGCYQDADLRRGNPRLFKLLDAPFGDHLVLVKDPGASRPRDQHDDGTDEQRRAVDQLAETMNGADPRAELLRRARAGSRGRR